MDITKMLAELRRGREQVEEAIMMLKRLARGHEERCGWASSGVGDIDQETRTPSGSKNKPKAA